MRRCLFLSLWAVLVGLAITGCQHYQAEPLVPRDLIRGVEQQRTATQSMDPVDSSSEPFSFARAARMLAEFGPALKEARAEYETVLASAQIATPLPNPSLDVGPTFGFGSDVPFNKVVPGASIGFTFPLNSRLARQDDLNRAQAEVARIEWVLHHREAYLELRTLYAQLVLGRRRLVEKQAIADLAGQGVEAGKKLVAAGLATSLDQGMLAMEAGRTRFEKIDAEATVAEAEAALSELLGVRSEAFASVPPLALPTPPEQLPEVDHLKDLLIVQHPQLARLRAEYEVAERSLRLEIERQYPDLRLSTSIGGDTGSHKTNLGLSLGIDLPIFDRNEQAIATAHRKREEIRIKYMASANRALAGLDRSIRACRLWAEKRKLLQTEILPLAQGNAAMARKSLDGGATDVLHYLDVLRTERQASADAVDADLAYVQAWVDLERSVGCPLLEFPGELELRLPPLPDEPEKSPEQDQENPIQSSAKSSQDPESLLERNSHE